MSEKKIVKKKSLVSRIANPKYIMVYATVIIFLIIWLLRRCRREKKK